MSALEIRRIATRGGTLSVELAGRGSVPILVLHGFTGSASAMAPLTVRLAMARRTVAPDLVGHGSSDAPRDVRHYAMNRCVDQLCELLDALALDVVDVVGYSMGGRLALTLCAERPERVRRAALVGASAGLADATAREQRRRDDEALATRIVQEGVESFVDAWARHPLFASQATRLDAEALRAARADRLRCSARGLAQSLRGMGTGAQRALHDQLGRIRVPILCLAGEDDPKFRAIATEMAEALPFGQSAVVPEAGHAAHLENPAAVTASIETFFGAAGVALEDTSRREPLWRP